MYRQTDDEQNSIGYLKGGNRKCIFFIHGLGGSNTSVYWGRLIELLVHDTDLYTYDFRFWKYKSSQGIQMPPILQPSRKERISTVHEVALALSTDLRRQRDYRSVSVIGHSLGGLIALLASQDVLTRGATFPLKTVSLIATPLRVVPYAWLWGAIFFAELNPHIYFLSRTSLIRETLSDGIAAMSAAGRRVSYFHCINDGFLTVYRNYPFSEFIDMQGPHNWMSFVGSREDANYRILKSEILRFC